MQAILILMINFDFMFYLLGEIQVKNEGAICMKKIGKHMNQWC